jgi:hypothetical protein
MNDTRWNMLPKELKTAVMIQIMKNSNEVPYFSKLLEMTGLKNSELHNALDHLVDTGSIDAKWSKTDNLWVREFFLLSPMDGFVNKLIDELQ